MYKQRDQISHLLSKSQILTLSTTTTDHLLKERLYQFHFDDSEWTWKQDAYNLIMFCVPKVSCTAWYILAYYQVLE